MEKKIFDNVEIHYDLPNVPNGLIILAELSKCKSSFKDMGDNVGEYEKLILLSAVMKNLDKIVEKIFVSGKEISLNDALKDFSLMEPLADVGTEILNKLAISLKKKQA